jgi:hypothetical protein
MIGSSRFKVPNWDLEGGKEATPSSNLELACPR